MRKNLLVVAGASLVSLVTSLTCVALASHGGRELAAANDEALLIPSVSEFGGAGQDGVQPWSKQNRSRMVSTARKARGGRASAIATNAAEKDDAVSQRSADDDGWLGKVVLPLLAGVMATGGIALVVSGLRHRPSKRHKQKHASMAVFVQNSGRRRHRGPLVPTMVSFTLAHHEKIAFSVPGIQDTPDTKESRKAA